jgi:2-polyprenyl-3-methyl-5-hydroxy-6-metoxy-1,4-benzoquinol methylase
VTAYDGKLARMYDRHVMLRGGELAKLITTLLPTEANRAVDLGCGSGYYSVLLAERHSEVLAVDASASAIMRACRLRSRPNIGYVIRDLDDISADTHGQFETVLSVNALHHVASLATTLERIASLVAPNGTAILVDTIASHPPTYRKLISRAMRLVPNDARHRGVREATELFYLRMHPTWLTHIIHDNVLHPDQFKARYSKILSNASFTRIGRDIVCVWNKPSVSKEVQAVATHYGVEPWRTHEEFVTWLGHSGQDVHPLVASLIAGQLR